MLASILIVGGLVPLIHAGDFPLNMLSIEDNVITGRFLDSLLLSLPPCDYAGKSVDLEYTNCNTNINYTLNNIFTVPNRTSCSNPKESSAFIRKIGYQLMNLNSSTCYMIEYKIGVNRSTTLIASTRRALQYTGISHGSPRRSTAMVVITVVLSSAMFILLISIIISVLVTCRENIT